MSTQATRITTPLALNQTNQCTLTPPWFVGRPAPIPRTGSFKPLVNGEEAFGEVHRAIAQATKSVCIICWGFQPSMHFLRDGVSPSIGELLEQKAESGVEVRVLCYAFTPTFGPMLVQRYLNVTGVKQGLDESNTPGRHDLRFQDRPQTSSNAQYEFDVRWYALYDEKQEIEDIARKKIKALFGDKKARNLHFASRGFSDTDRAAIAAMTHTDKGLAPATHATLAAVPSHHQKMVLVDYDVPSRAVGFVMGHNMLDEYWDRSSHSYLRKEPNRGRNGALPREDLSSRVTGPIIADLYTNFAKAWKKETREALPAADFASYAPRCDETNLPVMAQVLLTQPQTGVADIKQCYLQAVNNATTSIYIENQYFRWPPLAEKILAAARAQTTNGRCPEKHGSLHLFVVTNATDSGMGSGVINTYRMLDSLGRADTIPQVSRLERADDLHARLGYARNEVATLRRQSNALEPAARQNFHPIYAKDYAAKQKALREAEARQKALEQKLTTVQDEDNDIVPEERPGLKIHVCTLVAPDTPKGTAWVDVYVHAKLMIVNDSFLTLGSANINTRSMETDSELNIAVDRPEIARPLRQRLWNLHTNTQGAQDDPAKAFTKWENIIKENKIARARKDVPAASLVEFHRDSPERKNLD